MIQAWVESQVIKRLVLSVVGITVAQWAAHHDFIIKALASFGFFCKDASVDPHILGDRLTYLALTGLAVLHQYVVKKYPEIGKYL